MKCIVKKAMVVLLAAFMILNMIPANVLAANWNPDDKITIRVRVYDASTSNTYDVGTDTITKGDQNIQSDPYTIPELSKFTTNTYGTIQKVAGNWYFPTSDRNVGSVVYWSCNSDTGIMTYWVSKWSTGTGSGGGQSGNETINYGTSGSRTWKQMIVYHSNYPNGTDYTYTVTYNIKSYVSIANYSLKKVTGCGFTVPNGYSMRDRVWDTAKNGTGSNYADGGNYPFQQSENGKTTHLYAQWTPEGGTPATQVTVTYKNDNETLSTMSALKGDTITVVGCDTVKEGFVFKGWTTEENGTVKYVPGDILAVNSDITLYAVWEQNVAKCTITYQYPGNIKEKEVAEGSSITLLGAEEFYEGVYDLQNAWQLIGWEDQYGNVYSIGSDIEVTGNLVLKPVTTEVMLLCDGATEDVIGILTEDEYEAGKNSEIANGLSYNMATTFEILPGGDESFVVDGTRKITQQMEDEYEEAFAGWFYTPYENQLPYELDWSAENNVGEDDLFESDRVVNNRIYAYWIDADFLNTTIGYRTDDKCASKVYANSTVPGDIFRNYGFVLSTTAGENDENQLVIGGKIGAKPVGNFQKTAIYQKFKASPIYNKNYTAKEFNGGISGFDNNGSGNGYITYFYWKNMQLYDGIGNFTSLAARAYYTTLEGTVVYGDMTRVVFAANTVYPEGK